MGTFRGIELDDLVLTTDRLTLRPWRPADAERVAEIMADERMHGFLPLPNPYTLEDALDFIGHVATEQRRSGTGLTCALVERPTGRVIGSAALRLGTDAEVGYWTAAEARGRGFATDATGALARWAFDVGIPRVTLYCDVRNVASARVALGAGFRYEGVVRNGLVGGGSGGIPERRADLARFGRLAGDPRGPVPPAFPHLGDDELTDGVLGLRPLRPGDAGPLLETEDEETVRWSFTGTSRSAADLAVLADRARLDWLVGTVAVFAMVDRASGRTAGLVSLRKAGPPQVGGVGYVVHPAFRGRGYTSRALRLLAPWAFEVADFARLELGAKLGNVASLRAAAAAGWEPDGVRSTRLRNGDGTFSDEGRYALINPKYRPTGSS